MKIGVLPFHGISNAKTCYEKCMCFYSIQFSVPMHLQVKSLYGTLRDQVSHLTWY